MTTAEPGCTALRDEEATKDPPAMQILQRWKLLIPYRSAAKRNSRPMVPCRLRKQADATAWTQSQARSRLRWATTRSTSRQALKKLVKADAGGKGLQTAPARARQIPHVIVVGDRSLAFGEPKTFGDAFKKPAGLCRARIHDLRHTHASVGAG